MEEVQIAGVRCAECERRCVSDDDGAPCECGAVLHREDCWRTHWTAKHQKDPYRDAPSPPKRTKRSSEPERGDGLLFCTGCSRSVDAPTKLDLFGFPSFTCPKCGTGGKLPLASGRLLLYRIVSGVIVVAIVVAAINGIIAMPGLLGIALIYALVKDSSIRSRMEVRALAASRPEKRSKRKR